MKWFLSAFLLAAFLQLSAAQAQAIEWPLVARAQVIVLGKAAPVDEDAIPGVPPNFVAMKIEQANYIKRPIGLGPANPNPIVLIPKAQANLHRSQSIFFLSDASYSLASRHYLYVLADEDATLSVRPYSKDALIRCLLVLQRNWEAIGIFDRERRAEDPFSEDNERGKFVREILTQISAAPADPAKQKALAKELDAALGVWALYYLVYFMEEDWSEFAAGTLTVLLDDQQGNRVEATLAPELMIDAIDMLLIQFEDVKDLLQIERRFIGDHPSTQSRRNAIRAWKAAIGRFKERVTIYD